MVAFSHLEPGTTEDVWTTAIARTAIAPFSLEPAHVIVIAAHPDDETLGAGGLMRRMHHSGARITVVIATDGEGSHPDSPTRTPEDLARIRRREAAAAVKELAPDADIRFLGLPDGELDRHEEELATAVREAIGPSSEQDAAIVIAPWDGDGHRDHRVAGTVAAEVSRAHGIPFRGYPVWLWHWGNPDDVPWDRAEALELTRADLSSKRRSIAAYRSQVLPLSPAPGDEAVLTPETIEHFGRRVEIFIRSHDDAAPAESLPVAHFDDKYARHLDPWGFDSRWYEKRKRDVLLASLPEERFDAVLELGCATGALTAELAGRATTVLAVDAAETALDRARERLADMPNVELRQAVLPAEWPDGEFDLIVVSEIAYYWSVADLSATLGRIERALRPGGAVAVCHWRHPVAAYPATGDAVHAAFAARAGLVTLVHHEEEDFLLDVFGAPGSDSVARRTGLLP